MSRCGVNCQRFWDVTEEIALRDMPKVAAEQTVNGPFYVKKKMYKILKRWQKGPFCKWQNTRKWPILLQDARNIQKTILEPHKKCPF